jgi:hypothetical protein
MSPLSPETEERLISHPWIDAGRCPKCGAGMYPLGFERVALQADRGFNPWHRSIIRVSCGQCQTVWGDVDTGTLEILSKF